MRSLFKSDHPCELLLWPFLSDKKMTGNFKEISSTTPWSFEKRLLHAGHPISPLCPLETRWSVRYGASRFFVDRAPCAQKTREGCVEQRSTTELLGCNWRGFVNYLKLQTTRFFMVVSTGWWTKSLDKKWLFHHFHPFKNGCLGY